MNFILISPPTLTCCKKIGKTKNKKNNGLRIIIIGMVFFLSFWTDRSSRGERRMVLVVNFLYFLNLFCFVVALCDLVFDVVATFHLP